MKPIVHAPLALLLSSAPGLAQGAEDICSISGMLFPGTVPFDTNGRTTDGSAGACPNAEADLWWIAAFQDDLGTFRTCGGTTMDSVLYAYDLSDPLQGCTDPIIELACNDDACGGTPQSAIVLNRHDFPNFGGLALLRLGNVPGTGQGTGQVEWLVGDPDCPGHTPDALEGVFPNGNELCVHAGVLAAGSYPALTVHAADVDFYEVPVQDQETLTADVLFTHASGDIDLRLWDACGGAQIDASQSATDDERIVYQNLSGGSLSVWLEVHISSGSAQPCNVYDMHLDVSAGGLGTIYCSANANSTGSPAAIAASGSASSSAGDLTLEAAPVPDQTGVFFHGATPIRVPFGNGFRCAAGGVRRGSVVLASGNAASYTYDNSGPKRDLSAHIGSTRHFQFWYRDPAAGGASLNTSNAVSIDILP